MRRLFLIFSVLLSTVMLAQQRKVALIIGNEDYEGHFSRLHTPENDADAMYNVLRKLGFDAIIAKNVRRDSMSYYIERFAKLANGADISLFYYSGHAGIGKNDEYFLAPSGSYRSSETLIEDCYSFQALENRIKRIGAPTKIYIIDACRNSLTGNKDMIRYTPKSLTKNFHNTQGTIYCFATGVNKTAQTGSGEYSIFTESLLNHIGDTGSLYSIWRRISDEVTRVNSEQTPFLQETTEGLSQRVYLNPSNIPIYDDILHGLDSFSFVIEPQNASLFIDNKLCETKNTKLKYGQKYDVIISAKGYDTYKGTITATPYKTLYEFSLNKLEKASLTIQSNRNNAVVFFDNEYKGIVPVTIDSYTGIHDIHLEKTGYRSYHARPVLKAGSQYYYAKMDKDYPWFWDWDDDRFNIIRYHYGNTYPIGISYMYRPDCFRFSFGAIVGLSIGLFRGLDLSNLISTTSTTQSTSITIDVANDIDVAGIKEEISSIDGAEEPYSTFVDPYNEAKHYDASFLLLANAGYNVCNGIMVELGAGTGYHRDLYYMDHTYSIKQTVKTNIITNEVTESAYAYEPQSKSNWYKENGKWSPAMRLGIQFGIPLGTDACITLGGGYTYLFTNKKYSSLDTSLGIAWEF